MSTANATVSVAVHVDGDHCGLDCGYLDEIYGVCSLFKAALLRGGSKAEQIGNASFQTLMAVRCEACLRDAVEG